MFSVSDKYGSVNERIQKISELMKLHIQGVWRNAHKRWSGPCYQPCIPPRNGSRLSVLDNRVYATKECSLGLQNVQLQCPLCTQLFSEMTKFHGGLQCRLPTAIYLSEHWLEVSVNGRWMDRLTVWT